jgi:hypothetical protein
VEQPVLGLGLLGFSESVGKRLQAWASDVPAGWPRWRACDPHLADAWMIAGDAVEVLGRDEVVIHHPREGGERLSLNRAEVDRPLAFSTPLPEGFASAEFFDAEQEASVRQRLQRFEAWLRPLRVQFVLGSQWARRMGQYAAGDVVHVTHEGQRLAVIDIARWQAALLIPARPIDLELAQWTHGPHLASEVPPAFMRLSLYRVMWSYAVRSELDVLPRRYRERLIHLRRVPRLPARWFDECHLFLMREILARPSSYEQLLRRTSWDDKDLSRHLGALYHAGALTTDPDSARRAELQTRRSMVELQFHQNGRDMDFPTRQEVSGFMGLSTMLRDSLHSPLRLANGQADLTAGCET